MAIDVDTEQEAAMNIRGEVIQPLLRSGRPVCCGGVAAHTRAATRRRGRELPSSLVVIPLIACLALCLALVGLSAVVANLAPPTPSVAVENEMDEPRWIDESVERGGFSLRYGPTYTR